MNSSDANANTTSNDTNIVDSLVLHLTYLIPVKLAIGVVNILFNGYLIILVLFIIKRKSYSNILFMCGAFADFTTGVISIPFMTIFTTIGYWPLGKAPCLFWVINDFSVTTVSACCLLTIAAHRYFQIISPIHTTEKMTRRKYLLIAAIWIFPYSFWAISVLPNFKISYTFILI